MADADLRAYDGNTFWCGVYLRAWKYDMKRCLVVPTGLSVVA